MMLSSRVASLGTASRLFFMLLVGGIGLVLWSLPLSEYDDLQRAHELMGAAPPHDPIAEEQFTRDWRAQMSQVRSLKYPLQDAGVGLVSFCVTVLGVMAWEGKRFGDLIREARSPRAVWQFLVVGAVAWLALIPSLDYMLDRDLGRGYFPWWADSIAIALFPGVAFLLALLPVLLLVGWLTVRRCPLPVSLWHWDRGRPIRSWCWSLVLGAMTIVSALMAIEAVLAGDFIQVPAAMVGAYLFLAARAAATSRD